MYGGGTFLQAPSLLQLAYEHLVGGEVEEALKVYRRAFSLDETSMQAMGGSVRCQLILGQLQEARQQLELLNELQSSLGSKHAVSHSVSLRVWLC